MTALIVGNSRTEEMVGELAELSPDDRAAGGCVAQRMLWFSGPGDVLVLPRLPRAEYLAYVTGLTGVDPASLTLFAPPEGVLGADLLTPDRLVGADFRDRVRGALHGRLVDRVLAVFNDVSLVEFVDAVGLRSVMPGFPFSVQGGDALVNSKAVFRAVAAGAGVAIAPGRVVTRPGEAESVLVGLLMSGQSAMVKQEFQSGGMGNEILSPAGGVRQAGAHRLVVVPDAPAVARYVDRRWAELTVGGRHRLVIERYLPGCDTVYAEFLIGEDGEQLLGTGELLMEPVVVGEMVPAQAPAGAAMDRLVAAGRSLCRSFRAMGYRGYLSTDAVLTPDGEVVFTETNGRLSGSTHLHTVIGPRLAPRAPRVLLERSGWAVPSFTAALERLAGVGLAFDPAAGTGVVLTSDLMPDSTLTRCVVAEDAESARAIDQRVTDLFTLLPR
jgi:hypothetical protein